MHYLIKNGRVIDPLNNLDNVLDVLIVDGKIKSIGKDLRVSQAQILDATSKIVMPGLIDMHVHLREPGREDEETIQTGASAAIKGGVTSILAMANTQPSIDTPAEVGLLKGIIKNTAQVNVFIAGTITKQREGKELSDYQALKKAGVIAISDNGSSVDEEGLMQQALFKAKEAGLLVICHCEDKKLSAQGVVNRGFISTKLGLRGIPNESEYKRVQRDIELSRQSGCPIHIAHLSCKESICLVREAKQKGLKVTAETAPHYFALSDEVVSGYDTNMKINPPLRSRDDVEAIKEGLGDGTIDAIASDHAPHTESEKELEFDNAPFGTIGLETALAVAITELIDKGTLDWKALVRLMSQNPAKILNLDKGTLSEGKVADLIIVNPDKEWVVKKEEIVSKSKNCAFLGMKLKGIVEYTICNGKIVYRKAEL